uniref:Uncharacterized protein n=1 Tax=Sus scrofa TaxID=9823 RepID=A0A8W4FB42_PIG
MTSSSPAGLEGSDLSSINTMMSAVMSVGKVAENGGSPQNVKSPSKPPGPNRIGRRNQVSVGVPTSAEGVSPSPSFPHQTRGRGQS